MFATLRFVPSDRTFPFHQRNIFSVFPHPPVFTFAFTAITAKRVKNCLNVQYVLGHLPPAQTEEVTIGFTLVEVDLGL